MIYSGAEAALARVCAERAASRSARRRPGKGALPWDHPLALGAIGVTGTSAANGRRREADLVIGVGTRLQDFTTGSRALFVRPGARLAQINVAAFDAAKHGALAVVGDAGAALEALTRAARRLAGAGSVVDGGAPTAWRPGTRDWDRAPPRRPTATPCPPTRR